MTDKELLNCLKDRPCKACKYREKDGCTQWDCVFDAVLRQEPKTGHWIKVSMDKYVQHATAYYKCSECGGEIIGEHNYCPHCGAKMVEPQESEVEG